MQRRGNSSPVFILISVMKILNLICEHGGNLRMQHSLTTVVVKR